MIAEPDIRRCDVGVIWLSQAVERSEAPKSSCGNSDLEPETGESLLWGGTAEVKRPQVDQAQFLGHRFGLGRWSVPGLFFETTVDEQLCVCRQSRDECYKESEEERRREETQEQT